MRINRIRIKNFRCYYGDNNMDFNQNGKITLIYGESGFGKSSLLQFFRWMFYGNPDFGQNDDKPIFNEVAFNEKNVGEYIELLGQIEFEHLGVKYSLIKKYNVKITMNIKNARLETMDYKLNMLIKNNWEPFNGDVANKINSILPRGLSKYFFLDGERARDIVLNSKDLKQAIHSLFGLDAYVNAIAHLGSSYNKKTVIGYFNKLMTSELSSQKGGFDINQMQEDLEDLDAEIQNLKEERRIIISDIEMLEAQRDEALKSLGEATNKKNIEQIIRLNNSDIKDNENKIKATKRTIGDLFYKCYPYLFLSRITSMSSAVLRAKNLEFAKKQKNIFENLKKELLKEILNKNICVCGRGLNDEVTKHIDETLGIMPPDSYTYQFGQFVTKSKRQIQQTEIDIFNYDEYMTKIANYEKRIDDINKENDSQFETLKRLDEAKDLVTKLENIKEELESKNKKKSGLEGNIAKKKQIFDLSSRQLKVLIKDAKISNEYTGKIKFFQLVHDILEEERKNYEAKIRKVIDDCVREVYKKLTTQTELDADRIEFVKDDFTLRTLFLTGGQLSVDVYSYVIGIVKALQECKMENNETPIIIDAPFAFTDNKQSEHIFKTLPSISKQTILLTLDLNKIKKLLNDKDGYEFFAIKNNTQNKAIIERANINDIKF